LDGELENPGAFGKGRNSDKEVEREFRPTTGASDIVQPSLYYRQGACDLRYPECTQPSDVHAAWGGLRLQGPFGEGRSRD
jgi:hypothetical protein